MNVGVVYSANTGRVRWFHRPDPGCDPAAVNLLPGEAVIVLPMADLATLQAQVSAKTGLVPANDRYVLIPVGPTALFNIVAVHVMDLAIDPVPNGKVAIAHATAGPGWTYSTASGFVAPASVITK